MRACIELRVSFFSSSCPRPRAARSDLNHNGDVTSWQAAKAVDYAPKYANLRVRHIQQAGLTNPWLRIDLGGLYIVTKVTVRRTNDDADPGQVVRIGTPRPLAGLCGAWQSDLPRAVLMCLLRAQD